MKIVKNPRLFEHFIRLLFWSISLTESREFRTLLDVGFTLFFLSLWLQNSEAGPIHGSAPSDPTTYEAITGDSADDDHTVWDSFYQKKNHAFGRDAVGFLKDHLKLLKKGRAFVPAMGEGRNAIFLAKNGFQVDGVDLSSVAVDRAIEEARAQKTSLKGLVADLNQYRYPKDTYDLVLLSLFFSPALMPKFKSSLKKGGYFVVYLKLDTGKPAKTASPDDFFVKASTLKSTLSDLEILTFREYKDQGEDVIAALARKP
jgi:hypothetical protein